MIPSESPQGHDSPHHQEYVLRINRVIDHLREHLDRQVRLEELAKVACFSAFHFHRIFGAVTGESLNSFANRLRLEKATRLLRYSGKNLTDISLECGFSSSSTFSRAFRAAYGTSPSQFRTSGKIENSKICKELFSNHAYLLPLSEEEKKAAFPVRLVDFPAREVAYIRVANAYEEGAVIAAFETLTRWAKAADIFSGGVLFGMSIDDPHVTPKHLYRYEVCLASPSRPDCVRGLSTLDMPAMQYAVTRVSGDIRTVATAWDFLFRTWLVNSAYEPEHAPALEIFLDKESATDWSHFDLELCLPVRKLAHTRE